MIRQKMKKLGAALVLCTLVFSVSAPAMSVYARPRKNVRTNYVADETAMRDTAGKVQKAFDEKNIDELSNLCAYPLAFVDQNGNSKWIQGKKELKALGTEQIFTEEMREVVGSANAAKIQPDKKGALKLGEDGGVVLKRVKKKWKVTKIEVKGSAETGEKNMVQAAEQFQRTFYYRDLETLSKQCSYPVKIYFTDGTVQDIQSAGKLVELGENKVFTDDLVNQVNEVNAGTLTEGEKIQVGGISSFWMEKTNGVWKINMIVQ